MSGKLVLDTNIVMYLLGGDTTVSSMLQDTETYVSFITELELLSYHRLSESERTAIEELLSQCTIIDINKEIKQLTIKLRAVHRLKLPDAMIVATAQYLNLPLLTADKDLEKVKTVNIVIYQP